MPEPRPISPLARRAVAARAMISRGELDPWVGLFLVVAPSPELEKATSVEMRATDQAGAARAQGSP